MSAFSKSVDVLGNTSADHADDLASAVDGSTATSFDAAFLASNQMKFGGDIGIMAGSTADLTATAVSLSGATISYHINNAGTGAAAASTVGLYLSTDSTITTADTRLTTHAAPALAAGATDNESVALTLPTNLTPGTYYLGVIADYTNSVAESNETNNASTAVPVILGDGNANTLTGSTGVDSIFAFGGNDTIVMGANLTAADQIDGGAGTDAVTLAGNYSAGVVFGATTLVNVETLTLAAGFNYNFTTNDATVASGQTLTVDASALTGAKALTFNGSAETNGTFNITSGAGNDVLTGGTGNDTFNSGTGNDTISAGAGTDKIVMGANLTAADAIDGGAGTDTVTLTGDYSAGVTFSATTMVNVETVTLGAGFNYKLTTNDATVAAGQTLTVDASALAAANTLNFNGAAETNGTFIIKGGAGNDTIALGASLTAASQINGGAGTDTVSLAGNYAAGLTFSATTMTNVETLNLGAGFNYSLTTNDATVASGQTLTVDGSALAAANTLTFNGATDTNGIFNLKGGAGNDTLTTGAGADTITTGAGNDIVSAGNGTDTVVMGANLTAADQIDGGAGIDAVTLSGNYSAGVVFGATTMVNVETLTLGAGFNYNLTTNDATVASGQTLTVDASALAAANTLTFNGAAETNGLFNIKGGAGNDSIAMGAALKSGDLINGGAGTDAVTLSGNYSTGVTFNATTMVNVETLTVGAGFNYSLTTNDATVAAGQTMTIDGSALAAANTLTFSGAAETNGAFNIKGGAGNDTLTGGAGNDTFTTSTGNDIVKGGAGNDTFVFAANLTAADQIDGGTGTDAVTLSGNYAAGVTFVANTMVNVETLTLGAGFSYNFTTNDATVATGQTLTVDASALAAANTLTFNGAAETNGTFIVKGGAGNDTISLGASLTTATQIDGGAGADTVSLSGNYSAGRVFTATTMTNVETLNLGAGFSYNLTTNDATVASGQTLTVNASGLAAANTLTFNGAAETNGTFNITGGAGNDSLALGAVLTAASVINGGAGTDTVSLSGNYSAGLTFGATTMTNVETLTLGTGFSYKLTTNDATVASGQTLTVDGSALAAGNVLTFSGAAETNGIFNVKGGAGNDSLTGGAGNDTFTTGAGNDVVSAGVGNDTIVMGANLTAADAIDGGTGTDTMTLAGDYSAGVVFGATTVLNVETLTLGAGFNYNLTTNDATVASGQVMTVDASALAAANSLTFNGAAETNGTFIVKGGAGNDTIAMGAVLTASSQINGGLGSDTVSLSGNYSAGLTLGTTTLLNVETLNLGAGFSYKLTTNDATVATGQSLTVDGSALAAANTLTFNGAAETNGIFNIKGGAGNDVLTGGAGGDTFTAGAGNDIISAGNGADTIVMGANLTAADQIDGGTGVDAVTLSGNYATALTFAANTMVNVETLTLGAGFNYNLITNDATVASGQTLTVDGSALAAANTLTFNGSAETNGAFAIKGGAGNDSLTGGAGNDTFTTGTGNDVVSAGAGNDTIVMGASLTATDQIDGGVGSDTVTLTGDYSAGITFAATTMVNVETVTLGAGFNYKFVTNDATVAALQTLTVDASALLSPNTLTFNGAAETNGIFNIKGGAGNDAITTGALGDTITTGAGNDVVSAGAGADTIVMGANLTAADQIDGGADSDTLTLSGDYSAGVVFGATTMVNVEAINLASGFNYSLTTNDATVASGQTLAINGSALTSANTLTFNGAAETNGNFNISGGAGNDVLTTGAGADTFNSGAGNDIISAGAGADTINMTRYFTSADQIDGGAGVDTVNLAGDYSAAITFAANTMVNVENLVLGAGSAYNFITNDATVASGQTLTVNGLNATLLTFNGAAETNGSFNITSGLGNDVLTGGALADTFTSGAGNDTINGNAGNDIIAMTRYLTAADVINGGAGTDTVSLAGDYSAGVTFSATTMINVETLTLAAGTATTGPFEYNLTTNDATVASGLSLIVDGSALGSSNVLTFNGSAETNGTFNITGGAAADVLTGGSGNDTFNSGAGNDTVTPGLGNDTINTGAGNDTIVMAANLTATDVIDGGADTDTVTLTGDYSAGLTFGATTMLNVENLTLGAGFNYKFITNDATVASGQTLTVDASALASTNTLNFSGAAETNGTFNITGGAGDDIMVGGSGNDVMSGGTGNDTFTGGAGADMFTSGTGADKFIYTAVANSASTTYDTINDIDFSTDKIDFTFTVSGIDTAITTGALSTATFDTDMATAMTGHLVASHAILFTADSGTLSGQTFLIVDANGTAGYQANADFVINVTGFAGTLATTDFI